MRKIAALTVTLFLAAVFVLAEEIQLKDGTKITGKIVGVKDDVFQIKTSYGVIQVPRSDLISIGFPENQPAKTVAALAPIDESLEKNLYVNRTEGFRLVVPDGWVSKLDSFRKEGNESIVAALTSADSTLILLVTVEDFKGSLSSYRGLAEMQYQTNFTDYEKVSDKEIQLDGRTGTRLVWRGNNKDNKAPIQSLVIILPYEGKMLRLSFLTVQPLFTEALPAFEKTAQSYAKIQP